MNGRTRLQSVQACPCDPWTQHQPIDDLISRFIGQPCSCVLCEHLRITFLVIITASAGPQRFPESAYGTRFFFLIFTIFQSDSLLLPYLGILYRSRFQFLLVVRATLLLADLIIIIIISTSNILDEFSKSIFENKVLRRTHGSSPEEVTGD